MSRVFKDTVVTQSLPEAMLEHFEKAISNPEENPHGEVRSEYDLTFKVNQTSDVEKLTKKYFELNSHINKKAVNKLSIEELKGIENFARERLEVIASESFDFDSEVNILNTFINQLKDDSLVRSDYPEFEGMFMPAGTPSF